MDSKTLNVPRYRQRLYAREQKLELKAHRSIQELKKKEAYFKSNGAELISDGVIEKVSASNPFIGRIVGKILGTQKSKPTSKRRPRNSENLSYSNSVLNRFSRLGSALIPLIYTVGERKLLSYSFRGAGKLIQYTLGNLFGFRRKRRRIK